MLEVLREAVCRANRELPERGLVAVYLGQCFGH